MSVPSSECRFSPTPPVPITAENGVEFLQIAEWSRLPRLWHAFSTRRGGVSACYAVNDAKRELNLGFTPDDQRENVLENRRRLAGAVAPGCGKRR